MKEKKNIIISVPHAMHARNLFSSSFDLKGVGLILGNFSNDVKKSLTKSTSCDIKNFNFLNYYQSKIITLYSILLDRKKNDDKNGLIKLIKKNYNNCDLEFKKSFKHKLDNFSNKILFTIADLLFLKTFTKYFIIISSLIIYFHIIIQYKPKKILFMCTNTSIDKGLFFLARFFKIKTYGLINSWDHISSKKFIDIKKFDKLFIWNDYFKKELKNIHDFDLKKVRTVGLPHYDSEKKKYKKNNLITFFLPSKIMMHQKKQYEIIEFLYNYCKINKLKLYIKPHPGEEYRDLKKFNKNKIITIIIPKAISMNLNTTIHSVNFIDNELGMIIQKSKVVINFHSTTSLDSIFHLTPVICLMLEKKNRWFYKWPYYKYILKFNALVCVHNFIELKNSLNKFLENKNYKKKEISNLKKIYFGNFNPSSGKKMSEIIYND